jgi:hypothetical protein
MKEWVLINKTANPFSSYSCRKIATAKGDWDSDDDWLISSPATDETVRIHKFVESLDNRLIILNTRRFLNG